MSINWLKGAIMLAAELKKKKTFWQRKQTFRRDEIVHHLMRIRFSRQLTFVSSYITSRGCRLTTGLVSMHKKAKLLNNYEQIFLRSDVLEMLQAVIFTFMAVSSAFFYVCALRLHCSSRTGHIAVPSRHLEAVEFRTQTSRNTTTGILHRASATASTVLNTNGFQEKWMPQSDIIFSGQVHRQK